MWYVAAHAEQGDVIPDSGGVRKIRWSRAGMGKRGGTRVIYYFHSERVPVFLLAAYAKNEKADLSAQERKAMRQRIPILAGAIWEARMATKKRPSRKGRHSVGARIIEGLDQAIAWSKGDSTRGRVTLVEVPEVDVQKVRRKMGLSQAGFASKFGFSPATLRNWEQGRSRPDAPTRVLLAVIAKHPEAVEDVLVKH